jgi:hypothetical protein
MGEVADAFRERVRAMFEKEATDRFNHFVGFTDLVSRNDNGELVETPDFLNLIKQVKEN